MDHTRIVAKMSVDDRCAELVHLKIRRAEFATFHEQHLRIEALLGGPVMTMSLAHMDDLIEGLRKRG